MRRPRCLAVAGIAALVPTLFAGCVLFSPLPRPEVGPYALGMTYAEALAVGGDLGGERRPPWPPTSVAVEPPVGARDMRLVFTGQCVSAIELRYVGSCETALTDMAAHDYGPPLSSLHGEYVWSDGVRELVLITLGRDAASCAVTYRLARRALPSGPPTATHGLAACRARDRRARTRFHVDPLHAFQRHAQDELGYLLRAD